MRKDLKDIQEQKDLLMIGMSDVPLDSKEYKKMMANYKTLVETEEVIKEGKRKRGPLEILYKVVTIAISAAGVILVPNMLANKSYQQEQDMKLKNGSIWNLIGKRFDKN